MKKRTILVIGGLAAAGIFMNGVPASAANSIASVVDQAQLIQGQTAGNAVIKGMGNNYGSVNKYDASYKGPGGLGISLSTANGTGVQQGIGLAGSTFGSSGINVLAGQQIKF